MPFQPLPDVLSMSLDDDNTAETSSGRGVTASSRRRWGFRSFFSTVNGESAGLDSINDDGVNEDNEGDDWEMMQTNGLTDRNTIVDMRLRMDRFALLVALALIAAFTFAYFTNSAVMLATVAASDEQGVTDTVELYNTLFGFILFAGGKVFEVFSETLIFPTLTTYLHNCSLYPGDQPARVHSPIKTRAIFWGLKTVIIFMNVAFASVFVGQRTVDSSSTRRLTPLDFTGALRLSSNLQDLHVNEVIRGSLELEDDFFRPPTIGFEDVETCDDRWIDPSTVALGFPVHDWNNQLHLQSDPVVKVEIQSIGDYLAQQDGDTDDNDDIALASEILAVFDQGYRVVKQSLMANGLKLATGADSTSRSDQPVRGLVEAVAQSLNESAISSVDVDDVGLLFERRQLSEDFGFVSLAMEIPRHTSRLDDSTECGQTQCIYADTSEPLWSSGTFVAPFKTSGGEPDDLGMLVVAVDRVFEATSSTEVMERIVVTIGKLSWRLEQLDQRHQVQCDDAEECAGVSIPLRSGRGALLVGRRALATNYRSNPLQLIRAAPATAWTLQGEYSAWYSLKNGFSHASIAKSSPLTESKCVPTVDLYPQQASMLNDQVYSVALNYLLQDGVVVRYEDAISRRLALAVSEVSEASGSGSSASDGIKDIEIAVPTLSASVTIAGCLAMLVLMIFVVLLPTARVKLAPNTTPAAQYVQILTDDLYPDIVHKKRLRFANGDCLLFNEYIVDSIVLHAERNHKKKIYL